MPRATGAVPRAQAVTHRTGSIKRISRRATGSKTQRAYVHLRDEESKKSEGMEEVVIVPSSETPQHSPTAPMSTSRFTILGLEPSPEVFAIFLVYFVQGILGLSRLAVSFYFKDNLHIDPADMAIYTGISTVPWLIKPVYGFVSDTYPLFGYRRRSYLMACGVLGALAWSCLCFGQPQAGLSAALLTIGSVGTACSDVVVDSIVVERSRGKSNAVAGSLQSLCWGSAAVGGVVSSYFSGSLIELYGVQFVFGVTALFPLLVSASAVLIEEQRVSGRTLVSTPPKASASDGASDGSPSKTHSDGALVTQVQTLWSAIKQPSILYPSIFVFLWQATPAADSALFYFYTNELHFGPEFLGRIRLVGSLASLFGIWLYNSRLKRVPMRSMLAWSAVLGTALGLTQVMLVTGFNRQLGLSNELFSVADEIILTVLGRVSFMPILVLASRLCPVGVEATLFATLMSILNGGSVTAGFLGSMLTKGLGVTATDFDNLALLVMLCSLSTLLPLPLLRLLPRELDEDPDEKRPAADKDS